MHHQPPGNCNYAGMFIIWDRMFGTFQPEVVRKDLFGLAKQPMTFNAAKLNVNHFTTMANIGARDPPHSKRRTWWYRCTSRRVPARWTFRLSALFEKLPPLKRDVRHEGPKRKKWNGARRMGAVASLLVVVLAVCALYGTVEVLLHAKTLHMADGVAACVAAALLMSFIGQICDQHPGWAELASVLGVGSAVALVYIVRQRPVAAFFE